MATLGDYFETEARLALARIERELATPAPDAAALHAAVRSLRGAAQMARVEAVHRGAAILEGATRGLVSGTVAWSADVAERTRATVDDFHALVSLPEPGVAQERLARLAARWREAGVNVPAPAAGSTAGSAADRTNGTAREFREFAAREAAAIADVLETSVRQLQANPLDREPLRRILRRQRALLGSARLEQLPDVAEILQAVEDLTSVIAKLNIGTKNDWLDIYRVALEALRATLEPLRAGEHPPPSNALKRLRHMRQELLERYGTGETISAAHEEPGLVQVRSVIRSPEGEAAVPPFVPRMAGRSERPEPEVIPATDAVLELTDDLVVDDVAADTAADSGSDPAHAAPVPDDGADAIVIDDLGYRGDAAVERARELRDIIAAATPNDPAAVAAADELLDLVRANAV
jgi:hypothetical protein